MSPTGRAVAAAALAALSALWFGPWVAGGLLAAVGLGVAVDAWAVHRPPSVDRVAPARVVRSKPAAFAISVTARPGSRVQVRQPQTAEVRVEPAEAPDGIDGTIVALTRGRHVLGPVVTSTTGPLRLGRWVHRQGGDLTVTSHVDLPGARRIAASVQQGRFREPGLRRGPLGLGTEFESVRDYTPDDDVRRINWLATERVGRPMANQFREDTERDLWCLVDAGRLLASPVGDRTRLDVTLDALAAVAAVADVLGDRIGAVVFDDQVRREVPPRRAGAADLVRLLDDLEPRLVDSDYEAAFARVASHRRALVLIFTDLLDGAAAAPLLDAVPVLARRHAVVVAGVNDPDLTELVTTAPRQVHDLHRASVATDILDERDQVRTRLTTAGATVIDASVGDLASRCVGAYLRLKSTARL